MNCNKCGNHVSDSNAKFCPECGVELKEKEVITGGTEIPYEIIKQKSESKLENALYKGTLVFGGYGIIHAIVGLALHGEADVKIVGLFIFCVFLIFRQYFSA